MELDFALLADGTAPRPDGKVDVFGAGIDTIYTASVPARHARLALILRFTLFADDLAAQHELGVTVRSVGGRELACARGELPADPSVTLRPDEWVTLNVMLNFDNVVFPAFGRYELTLDVDGVPARDPLRLLVREPEQPAS